MTGPSGTPRLPAPLSPLIGREGVLEPVRALLRREGVRLVTLSGPGGVGKTRLAASVAEQLRDEYPGGVWFVPFAPVRDPALVIPTIAQAFGVRDPGSETLAEALGDAIEGRALLVLDNLEHLLAAGPALAELLAISQNLTLLVTSRTVLRISGEWTIPVPPLALANQEQHGPEALHEVESVRLFVERAQAADPAFALTELTAPAVVDICCRLDGLPLALELAASRLRHMPVEALLARLEQRLPLLTGGARDQPARLRTMRDAIGWSYRLLSQEEQALFRSLSVFAGGFTAEAASAVCGLDDRHELLDRLSGLVDCSLLRQMPNAPGRYQMLETIREFAVEELREAGAAGDVQRRHAAWCVDLVETAWPAFAARSGQEPWLDRLEEEQNNLRAGLAWLLEAREPAAVQLAGGLFWFWFVRGRHGEGRRWLEQALDLPDEHQASMGHRARAMLGVGLLAHFQGDDAMAAALVEDARALAQRAGFAFGQAAAPLTLGIIAEDRGAYEEAWPFLSEAAAASRESGDRANETLAQYHLGVVTWGLGKHAEAVQHWEAALAGQREIGDRWGTANTLGRLGLAMVLRGDYPRAAELLRESLRDRSLLGARDDVASGLANIASLAAAADAPEVAALLFGAEWALRERIGGTRKLPERAVFERAEVDSREALGASAFAEAAAAGRAMSMAVAVDLALAFDPLSDVGGKSGADAGPHYARLTRRELEILRLVAKGRTNPEIANELFIAAGTVRVHVSNVLAKLEARTRTEAVDVARRRGLI